MAHSSFELFSPDDLQVDSTSFGPFLDRARSEREQGRDESARMALGAYLSARLVDRCLSLSPAEDDQEGFKWQLESTHKFLRDLPDGEAEVSHLLGIIEAVTSAPLHRDSVLRMALVAFGYYLEHEGRLEEALEALGLAGRTYRGEIPPVDAGTLSLFVARLNRMLARWERATRAYVMAEQAGDEVQDASTVMLARIGRANVDRGQGNLPAARAALEQVIDLCASPELMDVQGRAWSDLAAVFGMEGRIHDSLLAKYRALLALQDSIVRLRVLGDLGISLRELGAYPAARQCFDLVLMADPGVILRTNSCIEMMEMESAAGNRLAFERFLQEARMYEDRMPPSMAIDFRYRMGIGYARFGKETRARSVLREALDLAERLKLNEWYFRIDRVLRNLDSCRDASSSTPTAGSVSADPAVAEVSSGLRELALTFG